MVINDGKIHGVKTFFEGLVGCTHYWLRNLGSNDASLHTKITPYHNSQAAFVTNDGVVFAAGTSPTESRYGVRPAVLIRG
jgi:hypothetical protein